MLVKCLIRGSTDNLNQWKPNGTPHMGEQDRLMPVRMNILPREKEKVIIPTAPPQEGQEMQARLYTVMMVVHDINGDDPTIELL